MQDHNVNGKRILAAILKSIKKKRKPNQTKLSQNLHVLKMVLLNSKAPFLALF